MGTRSLIGVVRDEGKIEYIYSHWDGYPDFVGNRLKKYYTEPEKIDALIALGDISILGREIGEKVDFDTFSRDEHRRDQCLAYGRDRGETGTESRLADSIEAWKDGAKNSWAEYLYLWGSEPDRWQCWDVHEGRLIDLYGAPALT